MLKLATGIYNDYMLASLHKDHAKLTLSLSFGTDLVRPISYFGTMKS